MSKDSNDKCIFCGIARGSKEKILEDFEDFVIFNDIRPSAPFHMLLVPKEHIPSINELEEQHKDLVAQMIFAARDIAKVNNMEGYKLCFNVGEKGGQVVKHLHLHLLGWQ